MIGAVATEGTEVYYESWGEGPTIVLGHGLGGNHAIWYQQVAALHDRYHVVTWDQRGFGRTPRGSGEIGPDIGARDLKAILDQLEVETAHVVGQSMGGWAALKFCLDNPQRASSLVLADTIGGLYTPRLVAEFEKYVVAMAVAPPPTELPLGNHPAVGEQLLQQDLARSFLYGQIGALTGPAPMEVTGLLLESDYSGFAADLGVPCLGIVGENDPIWPPDQIREAVDLVPDGRVAVIPETGHSPYFESPEAWNFALTDFVDLM